MRLHLSNGLLASLAVAGALVGGALINPASAQDTGGERKPTQITISGTALNPDGSPAAGLPVAIKAPDKKLIGGSGGEGGGAAGEQAPPDLLSQGNKGGQGAKGGAKGKGEGVVKTIGRGVTDDSGRFSVKVTTPGQGAQTVLVEIGEPTKSNWYRKSHNTEGKDLDLGNLQLTARTGG